MYGYSYWVHFKYIMFNITHVYVSSIFQLHPWHTFHRQYRSNRYTKKLIIIWTKIYVYHKNDSINKYLHAFCAMPVPIASASLHALVCLGGDALFTSPIQLLLYAHGRRAYLYPNITSCSEMTVRRFERWPVQKHCDFRIK